MSPSHSNTIDLPTELMKDKLSDFHEEDAGDTGSISPCLKSKNAVGVGKGLFIAAETVAMVFPSSVDSTTSVKIESPGELSKYDVGTYYSKAKDLDTRNS